MCELPSPSKRAYNLTRSKTPLSRTQAKSIKNRTCPVRESSKACQGNTMVLVRCCYMIKNPLTYRKCNI
jgi:hypothetical protein